MSNLSIGLVSSEDQESKTLIALLEEQGIDVVFHIIPNEITQHHIESTQISVWLLSVDDDHWHDNIDTLLDESDASIYFNEPGFIAKEEHLEYWCRNLVSRLYEVSGLEPEVIEAKKVVDANENKEALNQKEPASQLDNEKLEGVVKSTDDEISSSSLTILDSALDELQTTSVGLPSDIAAELVSELEDISPQLESKLEAVESQNLDSEDDELSPITGVDVINEENIDISFDIDSDLEAEIETNIGSLDEFSESGLESEDLSAEETLDFLDAAIVSHVTQATKSPPPENDRLKENELLQENDLSEENEPLKETTKDTPTETPNPLENIRADSRRSTNQFDEIDFSNIDIEAPSLESARGENNVELQSEFSLEEEEPESSGDDIALATTKEYQDAHEVEVKKLKDLESALGNIETDFDVEHLGSGAKTTEEILLEQEQEALDDEISLEGFDIDFDLEGDDQDIEGKAVFSIDDEEEEERELEPDVKIAIIDESLTTSGLTLEEDQEIVEGKAVFISDEIVPEEDDSDEVDEKKQSSLIAEDETLSGLSLEPTEELIKGKAVFQSEEEEFENKKKLKDINDSDRLIDEKYDHSKLSLENEVSTDGKAVFEIDDINEDDAKENDSEINEPNSESEQLAESLVTEQADPEESIAFNLDSNDSDDDAFSLILKNDFLNELNEKTADKSGTHSNQPESTIEIPMLEDAATDVEFEAKEVEEQHLLTPCWIIGASLGGPAAVKRFMQNLPKNINASFIVVQHIDENFLPVLAEILTTSSHFDVKVASGSNSLIPGSVFLAPLKGKLTFLRDGSMLVDHSQKWTPPYSPCIDDVMESLSSVYGNQCGAIIFSGMGQDGFIGAKKLEAQDAEVWAQSIETCANSSMPQAIINAGLAKIVATPEMLADRLVKKLSKQT